MLHSTVASIKLCNRKKATCFTTAENLLFKYDSELVGYIS